MVVIKSSRVVLRMIKNNRGLTLLFAGAVFYHNRSLEKKSRSYHESVVHILHVVIYLLRKIVSVPLKRLLYKSDHPEWGMLEEIVIRTLGFAARIGTVAAPRMPIDMYAKIQRGVSKITRHVFVEDVDVGKATKSHWIALDPNVTMSTPNICVIFYVHGGGFALGNSCMYINAHAEWLKFMKAQNVTAGVLSVEYPLAPEAVYPENLNFVLDVFEHLVYEQRVPMSHIIVAGDSAGGCLAYQVARHAYSMRQRNSTLLAPLAGLILVSPWVNHSCDSDSHSHHLETDYVSGRELLRDYSLAYTAGDHELALKHIDISPIHHDEFDHLPHTMVTLGTQEVFHDDIKEFSEKMIKAGIPVTISEGKDCPHIHPLLYPLFYEKSSESLEQMARFCVQRMKGRQYPRNASWVKGLFKLGVE